MIALLTLAAGATPASATVFCVPDFHRACPDNGTNVREPNLETAMGRNASDGVEDRVLIDTLTYIDPDSLTPSGKDILWIEGGGSTITSSSATGTYVADFSGGRTVIAQDLRIVIPAAFPDGTGGGVKMRHGEVLRTDIESRNSGATGFTSVHYGSVNDSHIYGADGGDLQYGVDTVAGEQGSVQVSGVLIEDAQYAVASDNLNRDIMIFNSRLRPDGFGVWSAEGADIDIQNSLIEAGSEPAVFFRDGPEYSYGVRMWNTTIVGDGQGGKPALDYQATGSESTSIYALIMDSIIWGFDVPYLLRAPVGRERNAFSLNIASSNVHHRSDGVTEGNVYEQPSPGSIDADPMFAKDRFGRYTYRLRLGSPSIDAGGTSQIDEDLDGNRRPRDGNGDGVARQDQGAFEFQPGRDRLSPKITDPGFRYPSRKRGAFVRFRVSEVSDLRVVLRPVPARGKNGKLRKTQVLTSGTGGPSRVKLWFRHPVAPGRYRLLIIATDGADNKSHRLLKVRVGKARGH